MIDLNLLNRSIPSTLGIMSYVAISGDTLGLEESGYVRFAGVPLKIGSGEGPVPAYDALRDYVRTEMDNEILHQTALAWSLGLPVRIESGTGVGKTTSADYICASLGYARYKVDCRTMQPEQIVGSLTANPDYTSEVGGGGDNREFVWRDGVLLQAIQSDGVLILDEFLKLDKECKAAVQPVLDAVLRGDNTVRIAGRQPEEIVNISPDLKIVAYDNPPGGDFHNREMLDPAEYTRWVEIKKPNKLDEVTLRRRVLGESVEVGYEELPHRGFLSQAELRKLPGYEEIATKLVKFLVDMEGSLSQRQIGANQSQQVYLAPQRILNFMYRMLGRYYEGDLNKAFERAIEYFIVNQFEDETEREQIREKGRLVRADGAGKNPRRRSLGDVEVPLAPRPKTGAPHEMCGLEVREVGLGREVSFIIPGGMSARDVLKAIEKANPRDRADEGVVYPGSYLLNDEELDNIVSKDTRYSTTICFEAHTKGRFEQEQYLKDSGLVFSPRWVLTLAAALFRDKNKFPMERSDMGGRADNGDLFKGYWVRSAASGAVTSYVFGVNDHNYSDVAYRDAHLVAAGSSPSN